MSKKIKDLPVNVLVSGKGTAFKVGIIVDEISDLLGRVLTVVDAILPEGVQNKSAKDLIKEQFSSKQNYFYELTMIKMEEMNEDQAFSVPVSVIEQQLVPFDWEVKYRRTYN